MGAYPGKKMSTKKILFYSHDTYGLGHINRVLSIGRFIAKRMDVSILLVSGSGIIHRMRIPRGIDYVKLPTVTKIGDDRYKSKYLKLSLKEIIRLRETILLDTTLSFEPDLFVVDNVPLGLKNEALKSLEALKRHCPAGKTVLTMRDILDDPVKIIKAWEKNDIYDMLDRYFDSVLVFGLKDIYDITKEYRVPEPAASKFRFCGYINKGETFLSSKKIRNQLDINGHKFILVTVGGGGDGTRIIEISLGAMESFKHEAYKSLVVLGPDFPLNRERKLRSYYSGHKNIMITDYVDHLPDFMNASDLVISMGGYNTVCEILSLKKKAIIVPRIKPRIEQLIRAEKLSRSGHFDYIHPENLSSLLLQRKIQSQISSESPGKTAIDMGGLDRSADLFEELLLS